MATKLIAGGAWVQIKVQLDDGKWYPFGMTTSASYDEDFAIQAANVLNYLGPISYDSQGYTCSVTINTYIPESKSTISILPDGGEVTIAELLPTRDSIQKEGKGKTFKGLTFVNTATQETINEFQDVIIASNSMQASPNAYLTGNMRLNCVKRIK
jgi:hypothetical protein